MPAFPIVKIKLSASEFEDYMTHVVLAKPNWVRFVTLHNTAIPSIGQRGSQGREGILTPASIDSLHHYYQWRAPVRGRSTGWRSAPHIFVDREGIWVFNPLNLKGTHSPSFNASSWGVEMLGNFASRPGGGQTLIDSFTSGAGLEIRQNAMRAIGAMFRRLGIQQVNNSTLRFHRDDPETTHTGCPGDRVKRDEVYAEVQGLLNQQHSKSAGRQVKIVIYRFERGPDPAAVLSGFIRDGVAYAQAEELARATGLGTARSGEVAVKAFTKSKYMVSWDAANGTVFLAERG